MPWTDRGQRIAAEMTERRHVGGEPAWGRLMLPYMHSDDGRTVFEVYSDQQFALGAG